MLCQKRILLVFHMDQVPLAELVFYARKLSHIYLTIFIIAFVFLCMPGEYEPTFRILLSFEFGLLLVNFFILRLVVSNASKCNTMAAIITCVLMVGMILVNLIYGLLTGYYKQLYGITFPIFWILLETSTIWILFGFHRKLFLTEVQDLEQGTVASQAVANAVASNVTSDIDSIHARRVVSIDEPIVYAHNPVLKKNSLELGTDSL